MNGPWQTWSLSVCGDDMAAVAEEVKATMKAYLVSEAASAAEVQTLRVHNPSLDGLRKVEMSVAIRFCIDMPLDDWLEDVIGEAIVGPGPGTITIPKLLKRSA